MMAIPVLHLITELSTGGAQTALLRLLERADTRRFSPAVACLFGGDGAVARRIRALDIPVTDLGMTGKLRLDALARFYRLLQRTRPTILHTWMFHANVPGRVIGRMAGVPVIIGSERLGQLGRTRRYLERFTSGLANRITCVSDQAARFLIETTGIPREKIVVIFNGIELDGLDDRPSRHAARENIHIPVEGTLIGFIGRLHTQKGVEHLIDAMSLLLRAHPQTRLLIVGDGPLRSALVARVARLDLETQVTFAGEQTAPELFLAAFDILAVPSLHEGMPNVVLEAMAARVPVVAANTGGTPELVVHAETGLLVPPSDAPALASALASLINDPALAGRFADAAHRRAAERFPLSETVRLTEALYEQLLREKG